MQISRGKVAQFHYILKNDQGEVLESTLDSEPMAYLHGYHNIIDSLEEVLEGKAAGDKFTATIEARDGYGESREVKLQRIPIKHLQGARKWKPGMTATVQTDEGLRQVTILKVGKFTADVDINHPLAGKNLNFEIEVLEVRDSTPAETAHGHAHGVGGHHH